MLVLDLKGNAYERGLAQGSRLKDNWKKMENDFFTSETIKEAKPAIVPNFVVRLALSMWGKGRTRPALMKHFPVQAERVRGLAKGLGITEAYGWGLQYAELLFCLSTSSLDIPGACTQIHAAPSATADGAPLTGRNYDFPNMLLPHQIVRRDIPAEKDRYATVTVTQIPNIGAHHGMNEKGLLVCVNNNRAWKEYDEKGVPYMLLLVEALETCATADEAAKFLTRFPARANAGYFGLNDASGDVRIVEFTAQRTSIRTPDESGTISQTNHFIAMKDANLPDGTTWKVKGLEGKLYAESSLKRHAAADRLMHENSGKITVDVMKSILRDHSADPTGKGDDDCVCCHGSAGSTLASIIAAPRDKSLWVATGTPCGAEYEKIEFPAR